MYKYDFQIEIVTLPNKCRKITNRSGDVIACDTPSYHVFLSREIIPKLYGHVLITGLGFGIAPIMSTYSPKVESITVVEVNENIIRNFGEPPEGVNIVHASAYDYPKMIDKHYDSAFHDIWYKDLDYVVAQGFEQFCMDMYKDMVDFQICLPSLYKEYLKSPTLYQSLTV